MKHPYYFWQQRLKKAFQDHIGMTPRTFLKRYCDYRDPNRWADAGFYLDADDLWKNWRHNTQYRKDFDMDQAKEKLFDLLDSMCNEFGFLPDLKNYSKDEKWPEYQKWYPNWNKENING